MYHLMVSKEKLLVRFSSYIPELKKKYFLIPNLVFDLMAATDIEVIVAKVWTVIDKPRYRPYRSVIETLMNKNIKKE